MLNVLALSRRNAVAAQKFFHRLLKALEYALLVLVTNKLANYTVAHCKLLVTVEHRRSVSEQSSRELAPTDPAGRFVASATPTTKRCFSPALEP